MEIKLIAMILGLALVLATTATVYTQSAFAATNNGGNTGNSIGVNPGGNNGGDGSASASDNVQINSASQFAHVHIHGFNIHNSGNVLQILKQSNENHAPNGGTGGLGCSPLDPRCCPPRCH